MRTFIPLLFLFFSCSFYSQNATVVDENYIRDSVYIENIIEFYPYFDITKGKQDAVRFKVKITNLGHQPIPNLMRVSNRTKYLTLLYNGEDAHDLNIQNGMEVGDWPWLLQEGESDEFYTGYVLTKDAGIYTFDQPLNVTWKYMGVSSPTEIVDLKNKKVF